MKFKYLFVFSLLLSCADSSSDNLIEETLQEMEEISLDETGHSIRINFKENVGWGYQIFEGTKMIINQEHIPAVQGMKGFETKEKAEIAANFVLSKIENGVFPPTISPDELDSIGVYSIEQ